MHTILPLASPEDREVLVAWGIADFRARFGSAPEGMWLPETAVDLDTLATLARHGVGFTVLMPQQAHRVRTPGSGWLDVSGEKIDPSRAYFVSLPGGESMTVVFGHGPLSRELAFGNLLNDGATFVNAIRTALASSGDDELIAIVADGETYGHHHEFGEMALAWAAPRAASRERRGHEPGRVAREPSSNLGGRADHAFFVELRARRRALA